MKTLTIRFLAALAATAAIAASPLAEARPGGVTGGVTGGVATAPAGNGHGNWHGGGGGHWDHGGWGHGGWGYRGGYWGPGAFWGGWGLGLGFGALAYSSPYYGGYYAYPYPGYVVGPGVAEYVIVDPTPGERVVRSTGQPVPAATRAPDPIFYPKSGQTPAQTEADRQECNRWATTQAGAMSDASIFQRATFACMEGRSYAVR